MVIGKLGVGELALKGRLIESRFCIISYGIQLMLISVTMALSPSPTFSLTLLHTSLLSSSLFTAISNITTNILNSLTCNTYYNSYFIFILILYIIYIIYLYYTIIFVLYTAIKFLLLFIIIITMTKEQRINYTYLLYIELILSLLFVTTIILKLY